MSDTKNNTLLAIKYQRGQLEILDQLLLPHQTIYVPVASIQDGHTAIKTMKVRGAPAIAIVAALSLAVELAKKSSSFSSKSEVLEYIQNSLEYLKTSRPTAVNLFDAAHKLWTLVSQESEALETADLIALLYIEAAERMLKQDVEDNMNIGQFGAEWLLRHKEDNIRLLTHCNTGALATAGHGTALGIIRSLFASNKLEHAYCTETRPYNQGSRLTAYELYYENIPSTLICDNMVASLLASGKVDGIVVGADRVAKNGDTANKIGTYQLAVLAKHFGIPMIIAAPTTSIDLNTPNGQGIPIEVRPSQELTSITGVLPDSSNHSATVKMTLDAISVWNPAFDVTPAELISAIVTEKGVYVKSPNVKEYDLSQSIL